ncbi:MAG: hypothetical protein M1297_10410 [Nitrospirae bacterium]|jgi:hypothetical protein|nr:hypothetical protein [Nitrospirota bacterium]
MHATSTIRFCAPAPGESSGQYALRIIEKIGSLEFALGLSRDEGSEILLREIRLLTSGLLVLNAVFFEDGHIRVPQASEGELLEKKWGVPLKWLSRQEGSMRRPNGLSTVYPAGQLEEILQENRITVLLTANEGILPERGRVFQESVCTEGPSDFLPHLNGGRMGQISPA